MLQFLKKTEKTAKSVSEATELALKELGALENEVKIEVVEEGAKGFLGLGAKEASVTAELIDVKAVAAKKFLSELFEAMNLNVEIKTVSEDNTLNIELVGDDMGIVIGKHGDTLDSVQYLTSLAVNGISDEYIKVNIDTENYRQKRYETLVALSERLAQKVAKTGRKHTLDPMNPYERRIIHANLQSNEEVTTFSIGQEPFRKVVIAPKNYQPYQKRGHSSYHGGYSKRSTYGGYKSYDSVSYEPTASQEENEE